MARPAADREAARSPEEDRGSGVPAIGTSDSSRPALGRLLEERWHDDLGRPVLIEFESGRTWTAGEILGRHASRVAELRRHPLRPGDRVALLAEPCGETLGWIVAVWTAAAVVVPLLPGLPEVERERLVRDAGARLLIDPVRGAVPMPAPDTAADAEAEAGTALLFYTSGTSGRPRGVQHTGRGILANLTGIAEAWSLTEGDRLLSCLPWNHVHGLWVAALGALLLGFPIVQARRFPGVERFYEGIGRYRPTLIYGVPTFWSDLTEAGAPRPPEPGSLRLIVSGSAALSDPLRARMRRHFGLEPLERYGMTEAGIILSQRLDEDRSVDRSGYPLAGVEVRTTDEGELEVRGPSVTSGYWRDPSATAEAFRDGWLRTGDLVEARGEGYRIIGRGSLDIIKCRGFKIAGPEIEQVLLAHPAVRECAVVGLPDPRLGEEIVAVVVLADAPGDAGDLRAHLADRLAGSKIPQRFLFVECLPRTPIGKIAKAALREDLSREKGM